MGKNLSATTNKPIDIMVREFVCISELLLYVFIKICFGNSYCNTNI